jgi:RNA polymerase sigma-70 factor (sigma-E family)
VTTTDDADYIAYVTGRLQVLRRVATQLAGDPHRGDDLVQQAITRLHTHWRRARRTENLDAYVYKILLRAFLDERRLRWASVRLRATPADPDHGAGGEHRAAPGADPATEVADRMLLRDALGTLPAKQRAVIVLRFVVDRPVDEVAQILGVAPGTVKSQTHDGLKALRRLLGHPPEPPGGSPGAGPRPGTTLNFGAST